MYKYTCRCITITLIKVLCNERFRKHLYSFRSTMKHHHQIQIWLIWLVNRPTNWRHLKLCKSKFFFKARVFFLKKHFNNTYRTERCLASFSFFSLNQRYRNIAINVSDYVNAVDVLDLTKHYKKIRVRSTV